MFLTNTMYEIMPLKKLLFEIQFGVQFKSNTYFNVPK
jgi:hypothetical protein